MEANKPHRDFSFLWSFSKAKDIVDTNEAAWDQCGLRIIGQHGCLEDTDNVCGEFCVILDALFLIWNAFTFKKSIPIY